MAALSFWGALPSVDGRTLAVPAAMVWTAGIVAFFGTWPLVNTLALAAGVGPGFVSPQR